MTFYLFLTFRLTLFRGQGVPLVAYDYNAAGVYAVALPYKLFRFFFFFFWRQPLLVPWTHGLAWPLWAFVVLNDIGHSFLSGVASNTCALAAGAVLPVAYWGAFIIVQD